MNNNNGQVNMKIKICGITREVDIDYLNELNPDMAGFIFVKGRRRYVTAEAAKKLIGCLNSEILSVGVFLNESQNVISDICHSCRIDFIQLHGNEDNDYINEIRKKTMRPVIKAFKIQNESDAETIESSDADLVLLDAGEGGGSTFDWELAKNIRRPYLLAGGLTCENADRAVKMLSPYGVDISSGVETDGFKDYLKIREFIKICRNNHQ